VLLSVDLFVIKDTDKITLNYFARLNHKLMSLRMYIV